MRTVDFWVRISLRYTWHAAAHVASIRGQEHSPLIDVEAQPRKDLLRLVTRSPDHPRVPAPAIRNSVRRSLDTDQPMIVCEFGDAAGPALAPPRRVRATGLGPAPALGLARAKRTLGNVAAELLQRRFGVRFGPLDSARNPSARFTRLARKLHVHSPDALASELQTAHSRECER